MKAGITIACTAVAATLAVSAPARAADPTPAASPASIPVATFFNWAEMSEPVMAPDGSSIAIQVRNKAGRRQLAVIDTADLRNVKIAASMEDYDVEGAQWVNSKRLVFSIVDESESAWHQKGSGLYAVDRDGENFRTLIRFRGKSSETGTMIKGRELAPFDYMPGQTLADGSDDVIVYRLSYKTTISAQYVRANYTGSLPLRLNTRTGELSPVLKGIRVPSQVWRWAIDGQGRVLAGINDVAGESALVVPRARPASSTSRRR